MHAPELQLVADSAPRRDTHRRSDASIIARSRQDPHAFEELFDRYWPALHAFCCARAGEAGEDVAAETFRVAFDKRRRYDPSYDDARPWLYGIAAKLLQHHFRDRRRREAVTLRSAQVAHRPAAQDAAGDLERQLLGPQLAAALAGLTLTATAPAMPSGYQEQLVIGADTGVPVKFLGGAPANPQVTVTYDVTRVSTDELK